MGRFTQMASDRYHSCRLRRGPGASRREHVTLPICELAISEHAGPSCRARGGVKVRTPYYRGCDRQDDPGRGVPVALRLSRDLKRGMAWCAWGAAAVVLASTEIG